MNELNGLRQERMEKRSNYAYVVAGHRIKLQLEGLIELEHCDGINLLLKADKI